MKSFFICKRIIIAAVVLFLLVNFIAIMHAWRFTHFSQVKENRTGKPESLSMAKKISVVLLGVNNPKSQNHAIPGRPFKTLLLEADGLKTECWLIPVSGAKGTIVMFHGYGSRKADLLTRSKYFNHLGYSTLLVDFRGAGGSSGNTTSIGFYECREVKQAVDFLTAHNETNIVLYGSSMGAVSILKALSEYSLPCTKVILECPFGTLRQTVYARFRNMNFYPFPMADLLLFWGGFLNGFNAFEHNPIEYAKKVRVPVLLMHGIEDKTVSFDEIYSIFRSIPEKQKRLKLFPYAGHEDYHNKFKVEWESEIKVFCANSQTNKCSYE